MFYDYEIFRDWASGKTMNDLMTTNPPDFLMVTNPNTSLFSFKIVFNTNATTYLATDADPTKITFTNNVMKMSSAAATASYLVSPAVSYLAAMDGMYIHALTDVPKYYMVDTRNAIFSFLSAPNLIQGVTAGVIPSTYFSVKSNTNLCIKGISHYYQIVLNSSRTFMTVDLILLQENDFNDIILHSQDSTLRNSIPGLLQIISPTIKTYVISLLAIDKTTYRKQYFKINIPCYEDITLAIQTDTTNIYSVPQQFTQNGTSIVVESKIPYLIKVNV